MTDLATLVVKLEAQSAQYVAELDKANKRLAKFHSDTKGSLDDILGSFNGLKDGLTEVVEAFAVKEIAEYVNKVIEGAAETQALAKETGIATEQISALDAAAKAKGVDDLGMAMNRLARSSREALDPTSDASAAFKSIGVSVVDASGKLRPLDKIFLDIADAFAKYKDGTDKSAIATTLLSRSGYKLISFMDQGRKGIQDAVDSMGDFVKVSDESSENAEKFEDNLNKLKIQTQATVRQGIEPFLPALIAWEEGLIKVQKAAGDTGVASTAMDVAMHAMFGQLATAAQDPKIVEDSFNSLAKWLKEGGMPQAFKDVYDGMRQAINNVAPVEAAFDSLADFFKGGFSETMKGVAEGMRSEFDSMMPVPDIFKKAFFNLIDDLKQVPLVLGGLPPDPTSKTESSWDKFVEAIHTGAQQIIGDVKSTSEELTEFTPNLPKKMELPKKPIPLVTGSQLREQADAYKQLVKVRDTVDDQVASFGLGSVAVMKYSLEFGKLHEVLMKAGPDGKVIEQNILAADKALEILKNQDALTQITAHMDDLKNNTAAAAAALFDLQNRQLAHNLIETGDQAGLDKLNHLRDLTVAQAKYNDLQTQAGIIQDQLKLKEDSIQRAVESGSETELQAQGELKDAREGAVNDLTDVYNKMKAISDANAKDMPKLVQSTDNFKSSLDDLQVKTNEVANKMRDDVVSSAADAWASWVDGEKSAKDAFKDFIKGIESDISQLIAKNMFEGLLKQFAGGGGFFDSLAGLFTGGAGAGVDTAAASAASGAAAGSIISETAPALLALAHGGTVKPQKMYIVGEHGPEIIVPTHHGVVIPNHRAHALVGGLAPRSFAHHGSISEHHSSMVQVRAPKHAYQAPAVHIGRQHGHQESIVRESHHPRQAAMIHATHSPQFIHTSKVLHSAAYAHRALGGPVTQGRGTMVGEYGPELYAPTVNTAQLETNRMDKSVHVTNNFVLPPGGNVSRATQSQIASSVARSVQIASVRNQ